MKLIINVKLILISDFPRKGFQAERLVVDKKRIRIFKVLEA